MVQITELQKATKSTIETLYPDTANNKYNTLYRCVAALLAFQARYKIELLNPIALSDTTLYMVFKDIHYQFVPMKRMASYFYNWMITPVADYYTYADFEQVALKCLMQYHNNLDHHNTALDALNIRFNYLIVMSMLLQNIKPYINFMTRPANRNSDLDRHLIGFIKELDTIRPGLFRDLHIDTNNFEFESILTLDTLFTNIDATKIHRTYNILFNFFGDIKEELHLANIQLTNIPNKYEHFIVPDVDVTALTLTLTLAQPE